MLRYQYDGQFTNTFQLKPLIFVQAEILFPKMVDDFQGQLAYKKRTVELFCMC